MAENIQDSVWLRTRASLLLRLRDLPDSCAWAEFYKMYWRVIYGYAVKAGLSAHDAEEIVQDTMVAVFRQLPHFEYNRSKGRFLSWLKTITRSKIIDFFRRRQCRVEGAPRVDLDNIPENQLLEAIPDSASDRRTSDSWQEEWEQSVLVMALERVRERIEKTTFEAFRLYAIENRSPNEVAESLGITPNAVYVYKNRVIALLRNEVKTIQKSV